MPIAHSGQQGQDKHMPPTVRKRRILVVDDNHDAADTLVMLLDLLGYEASAAYDGRQGVVQATACRPDLVILDINMPEWTATRPRASCAAARAPRVRC
jgi:CheY-like chemotaxis protein